jgi:hypothetical protein
VEILTVDTLAQELSCVRHVDIFEALIGTTVVSPKPILAIYFFNTDFIDGCKATEYNLRKSLPCLMDVCMLASESNRFDAGGSIELSYTAAGGASVPYSTFVFCKINHRP